MKVNIKKIDSHTFHKINELYVTGNNKNNIVIDSIKMFLRYSHDFVQMYNTNVVFTHNFKIKHNKTYNVDYISTYSGITRYFIFLVELKEDYEDYFEQTTYSIMNENEYFTYQLANEM